MQPNSQTTDSRKGASPLFAQFAHRQGCSAAGTMGLKMCPAWTPTAPGHRRSRPGLPGLAPGLRSGRPLCIPTPCKRSLSTAKLPQRAATSRSSAPNWSSPCFAHFVTFSVPPLKNLCNLPLALLRRKLYHYLIIFCGVVQHRIRPSGRQIRRFRRRIRQEAPHMAK